MHNPHPLGSFWFDYAEKFGVPDIKYCEQTISHFISEPSNTWSNLIMIFVGIYLHFKSPKVNRIIDFYGIAIALMGLFSFTYHLSNNFPSQFIDFLGMYCTVGLITLLNFKRLGFLEEAQLKKIYYISFIPFSIVVLVLRYLAIPIQTSITLIVFVILASEVMIFLKKTKVSYKYFLKGGLFTILAVASQLTDVNRLYCDSQNHILQPHALWHVFNGIAFYYYYYYFFEADKLSSDVA